MLEYARQLGDKAGAGGGMTFVQGDMADFAIPGLEGRLDAAVCLLGTFSHMLTNDQAVGCFSSVTRHLRPGGMFLLELAHPGGLPGGGGRGRRTGQRGAGGGGFVLPIPNTSVHHALNTALHPTKPGDLFDGSLLIGDEGGEMWEVESATLGSKLMVEWGAEGDDFDPATQVLSRTVVVNRLQGEDVGEAVHESRVRQRSFTLQELDLLGRLAGLRLRGSYGDLSLEVGLTHEDAYRLVAVFVKDKGV
jgi:hypothetical protein